MATHVVNKDRNTQLVIKGDRDTWTLGEDATMHVVGTPAISIAVAAKNTTFNIDGDILSTGVGNSPQNISSLPIALLSYARNTTVNVGTDAHITSAMYGIGFLKAGGEVNNKGEI